MDHSKIIDTFETYQAASVESAAYERNHALQLENDLKKVCAELEDVKKIVVQNKNIAEKTIKDLNTGLDRFRIGIKVMIQRIFGNVYHFSFLYFELLTLCFAILTCCNSFRLGFSKDEIRSRPTDE